ncbi:MAG: hypothetical protein EP319_12065 [Deltaproteobacteria bacterium]|nr:MAG: hypothetical protein EP319_12065 [Deltaproteobacteria bacterium]
MTGKKKSYLNLFKKSEKDETAKQSAEKNKRDKQLIEEYKSKIQELLKDPESLKKAAGIIEEMLKQEPEKNKKSA